MIKEKDSNIIINLCEVDEKEIIKDSRDEQIKR